MLPAQEELAVLLPEMVEVMVALAALRPEVVEEPVAMLATAATAALMVVVALVLVVEPEAVRVLLAGVVVVAVVSKYMAKDQMVLAQQHLNLEAVAVPVARPLVVVLEM